MPPWSSAQAGQGDRVSGPHRRQQGARPGPLAEKVAGGSWGQSRENWGLSAWGKHRAHLSASAALQEHLRGGGGAGREGSTGSLHPLQVASEGPHFSWCPWERTPGRRSRGPCVDSGSEARRPRAPMAEVCPPHGRLRNTPRDTRRVSSVAMTEQLASEDFLSPNQGLIFPKWNQPWGRGLAVIHAP